MRLFATASLLLILFVAARADASKQSEARAHFKNGLAHYDLAEYETAIAEFKVAYELSHEPGLLFNLAQAYRLKKDYAMALHFYQTYLELLPDAPNRKDAETQIANMKAALASTEQPAHSPSKKSESNVANEPGPPMVQPSATPSLAVVAAPPPPSPSFVHTRRGIAVVTLSVLGGAALLAGAGTGGGALSLRSQYDSSCNQSRCDGSLYDTGRGLAIATDVMLAVGAVAVVAAVVLAVTRPHARAMRLGMNF